MTNEVAKRIIKSLDYYLQNRFEDYGERNHEAMLLAIKALEQESVLDKIRAEIDDLDRFYDNDYFSGNRDSMFKCNEVLQIIDKYRESEVRNEIHSSY